MNVSRENEPPAGTWVKDRHGGFSHRNPDRGSEFGEGWGVPGFYYQANWQAMWDARGPLVACGPWGSKLPEPVEPVPSEPVEPHYVVTWSYVDEFGIGRRESSGSLSTPGLAQSFASIKFATTKPDAWWVSEIRVIEYHEKDRPND